jgi:hypothetical protein
MQVSIDDFGSCLKMNWAPGFCLAPNSFLEIELNFVCGHFYDSKEDIALYISGAGLPA